MSGSCLDCYPGYTLSGGSCIVSSGSTTADLKCYKTVNGACAQCYSGYYIGVSGICMQVNTLCRTFSNLTGACLSCYQGYTLVDGNCSLGSSVSSQSNCAQTDAFGQCTSCYSAFYLSGGKCLAVDQQCKTRSNNLCTSCYDGYALTTSGGCILALSNTPVDPYCIVWSGMSCVQCSTGFYLKTQVGCSLANPLCKTFDFSTGNCLTCYPNYVILNDQCVSQAYQKIPYC